jgi:site-specific DNA-methyltransferase (adenine-specific)
MGNKAMITLLNDDCMNVMAKYPDKYFDLAIVDPPYGIGEGNKKSKTRNCYTGFGNNKTWVKGRDYGGGEFDYSTPDVSYFDELKRISINQIIWGGNYMVQFINPSMGWVVWDKDNGECDQSDCELAYTSFNKGLRKFRYKWQGLLQENMKDKEDRIHPTQKPVQLYKWLLKNYAKPIDKIIDTHGGSMSSVIACYDFGITEMVCCEIDKEYFDAAVKRFENHKLQQTIKFE